MKTIIAASALLLAACSPNPAVVGAMDMAMPSNNAVSSPLTFTIEPFDVMAGTERQVCKTITLPMDAEIDAVRLHAIMSGTSHHFDAYKILDPTGPVPDSDALLHDCQPAQEQLAGKAAIIIGISQPEGTVETPPHVSYHLKAGEQIILEQHVLNYTTSTSHGGVTFDIFPVADPSTIEHHADMMWMANWVFDLPMGETTSSTADCAIPYDVQVYAVTSHTHHLGTDVTIGAVMGTNPMMPLYENLDWSHPPYFPMAPMLSMKTGDKFSWTCTWNNTTDHEVGPGKLSTDEMCITYAYAYPTATMDATPVRCNRFF